MDARAAYLDQFSPDHLPPDAERLLWITLSLMEVANAVELFKRLRLNNGFDILRFVPLGKTTQLVGQNGVVIHLSPCDLEFAW